MALQNITTIRVSKETAARFKSKFKYGNWDSRLQQALSVIDALETSSLQYAPIVDGAKHETIMINRDTNEIIGIIDETEEVKK